MIKIATILPYKENYTYKNAGAAALWVRDFFKYSKYKKDNYIFGSTSTKDYLTKNYININLKNNSKFSFLILCIIFLQYSLVVLDSLDLRLLILIFI